MQNVISKDAKIAVLCGGMSSEREVSMRSGKGCFEALQRLGFKNAQMVVVDENIAQTLKEGNFDIAYNALHGKYGEDGCIQGLLEILKIPYTGCGVMASSVCMNKEYTKRFLNRDIESIEILNCGTVEELIYFCKEHHIKTPFFEDICALEPSLLHSYASKWLARHLFGVKDKEILNAVAEHTLGSLHMSTLSKILFVADISSKDRKYKDAFVIRNMALQDLDKALLYAANRKLLFTIDSQKWLCPLGIDLWNHLIKQEK